MKNFLSKLVYFIKIEAIFILITMGIVAIICWKYKILNHESYRNGLSYAGCAYMILGLMSIVGNNNLKGSKRYWEVNNKFLKNNYSKISQEFANLTDKSFIFLVKFGIIGLTLMLISFFI